MNKADLTKEVYKVIPVNCNGCPECDGGLAGAFWRVNPLQMNAYKRRVDGVEINGYAISTECVFIDTMRGLGILEKALIGIGKLESMILLCPKIGGGIAGFNFESEILPLIEKHLQNHDVIFVE